jgi:hypothetical protein
MHEGVEGRFPYLNNEWINFTFSLPDEFKRRDGQSKFIWHKLSEKYFPQNYFIGQKKGFGVPNDFLMKSKKINQLFSKAILDLKNRDIIRTDIDSILEKINLQESFALKMYLLSLNLWNSPDKQYLVAVFSKVKYLLLLLMLIFFLLCIGTSRICITK